jgi:non-heme Fe2+,alpha-ketoglutarate-dependent halogenase
MTASLKRLTRAQLDAYRNDGGIAPVSVFSAEEAARYRESLENFERELGTPLMDYPQKPSIFSKSHLLFPWIDAIVRHPAILDAIEDIIGPNIRVFHNNVFVKEPHSGAHVTWHQDGAYNGMSPPEVVTAWVALTESTPEMGCVRILKGSQKHGLRVHAERKTEGNLLSRGHRIEALEDAEIVDLALGPGEMSLHQSYAVHASEPNRSGKRRIGVMSTYFPPHCRYVGTGPARMRAALVRGRDDYGYFDDEPSPVEAFGVAERAAHLESCTRYIANVTSSENQQLPTARMVAV